MKKGGKFSSISSTLSQIQSGTTLKKKLGPTTAKTKTVESASGKYAITESKQKFEESGVSKKKRNYVMYEAKLGTEKKEGVSKISVQPEPRKRETIVQTRKKKEYLDNFQYKETKDVKENKPNRESLVRHRRLGDAIGGTYEEKTFTKRTTTNAGKGPSLYSSQTTKTTTRTFSLPKNNQSAVKNFTSTNTTINVGSRPLYSSQTARITRTSSAPKTTHSAVKTTTTRTTSRTSGAPKTIQSVLGSITSTNSTINTGKVPSLYSSQTTRTTSRSGIPKTSQTVVKSSTIRTASRGSGVPKTSQTVVKSSTTSRGSGLPKTSQAVVKSSTIRTTSRGSSAPKTSQTVVRSSTSASKTLPGKSQNYAVTIKKFSTSSNLKNAFLKPSPATTSATRTITTKTVSTRAQSAGKG